MDGQNGISKGTEAEVSHAFWEQECWWAACGDGGSRKSLIGIKVGKAGKSQVIQSLVPGKDAWACQTLCCLSLTFGIFKTMSRIGVPFRKKYHVKTQCINYTYMQPSQLKSVWKAQSHCSTIKICFKCLSQKHIYTKSSHHIVWMLRVACPLSICQQNKRFSLVV